MLKDEDRIFQNLYNDFGAELDSAKKRGDWLETKEIFNKGRSWICLLYTSPSPRDATLSRMPSSA